MAMNKVRKSTPSSEKAIARVWVYSALQYKDDISRLLRRLRASSLVKKCPKLKSRYRQHVKEAIEYVKTIDDFDDLVDLRTLALHCHGPEPSAYILHVIEIEEKKKMTTEFNQGMYA
ncbi:hypothetical protein CMV_011546 [Castanea mollissima]|uniref:Uncharacterized protein n=1 Tax=Castanea mollissima TaxID=60419 RepID=A0A8J4VWV1_9ROSI|nr:hypothetical protein CMV_011546 [Castanea mollissima]